MFVAFGLGVLGGVLAVVGLLRLTMSEEPTGCFIVFGGLCLLILLALVVPQLMPG